MTLELKKFRELEKEYLAMLKELAVEYEKRAKPIQKNLEDLYAIWPTRKVIWRDLETGAITSIEEVRE